MTKRDVAVWFCKVVALGGMISAAFYLLGGVIGWRWGGGGNLLWPALNFAVHLFTWLFARGIGTEIAAEGEHGELMTSSADLGALLLRCVGLSLFLYGALLFGSLIFSLAFQYFSTRAVPSDLRFMWPNLINGFLQATIGFFLAFGPRLRAAMRTK